MFFYEGLTCPVCGKPFADTDDIVACPDCGAPHHRDCWNAHGGCFFAADHGTDRQWSREKATHNTADAHDPKTRCPNCGAENPAFAEFCSHCGRELTAQDWQSAPKGTATPPQDAPPVGGTPFGQSGSYQYTPFRAPVIDPCGGIPPEESIEGEKACDLASVVRVNPGYYMPRFSAMAHHGSHVRWNWPAFLIPSYWLLYRKQYLAGGLMLLFNVLQATIINYISFTYFADALSQNSYPAMFQSIMQIMQTTDLQLVSLLITALTFTNLLLRLLFGLFANRLYMRHCLSRVRKARTAYPEGYQAQLSTVGGVSFALGVLAYLCIQIVPSMILYLLL